MNSSGTARIFFVSLDNFFFLFFPLFWFVGCVFLLLGTDFAANREKAMDADSWSVRPSSASRAYKSVLQSRSGTPFCPK